MAVKYLVLELIFLLSLAMLSVLVSTNLSGFNASILSYVKSNNIKTHFPFVGNVWRFPYVIATNGGAAAVVAYLICAVFVAWPLFIYELILGQYLRLTFVKAWEMVRPRWLSFGWAQFLLLFIAQSYFSMIITYTLPYIVGSCQEPLPWTDNTASQEYWEDTILNSYDDINDKPAGPGPIQWRLAVSLLVFWAITFFSVAFGKNILSQITYVTVTMPVVLVSSLLVSFIH